MEDNFSLSGDHNVTHVMLDVSHRLSGFVSLAAYQNNGRLLFRLHGSSIYLILLNSTPAVNPNDGVPSQDLKAGLPYIKLMRYCLSHASPWLVREGGRRERE
jgi:hypothetical protein